MQEQRKYISGLPSPKVLSECYFGVDIANKKELVASYMTTEEICHEIGANTLEYLSLENLLKILREKVSDLI